MISPIPIYNLVNTSISFRQYWYMINDDIITVKIHFQGRFWASLRSKSKILKICLDMRSRIKKNDFVTKLSL